MNKTLLLSFPILFLSLTLNAQLTSLSENFDISCPSGSHGPSGWLVFNPVFGTMTDGSWTCGPSSGRSGTPGISCTGLFGTPASYQLDTSILISPMLDLSGYVDGSIYLNFDTKTTVYDLGARVQILVSTDTLVHTDTPTTQDLTPMMMPVFGSGDASDWVTHQVDLSSFRLVSPLFVGFRYVSASGTTGSRWFLDNIHTTTEALIVTDPARARPAVTGYVSNAVLHLNVTSVAAEPCDVQLFDLTGRMVCSRKAALNKGANPLMLHDMPVNYGMYIVKVTSMSGSATARINSW